MLGAFFLYTHEVLCSGVVFKARSNNLHLALPSVLAMWAKIKYQQS